MHKIEIPKWHPWPVNKLLHCHWAKAARRKREDAEIVWGYSWHLKTATCKRRVHLTIRLRPRRRACDPDAYWKSLLDALVRVGMLVDDSRRWCETPPPKFERGTESDWGTVIELEDIP